MARPGTRKIQRYSAEVKLTAVKLTDIEELHYRTGYWLLRRRDVMRLHSWRIGEEHGT